VFKLDRPLSNIPGVRLQQFHASPENSSLQSRRKAGFIELSIPLAELGSPGAGDEIQLGAVVAGALDLVGQRRWVDTGFLGTGLFGAGLGSATLEPVRIRLTVDPTSDPDQDGLPTPVELSLGTDPAQSDSDGDGLPDRWEVINRLEPSLRVGEAGPGGDPDNDGASNWAELWAGTNPRDPHSVLRIEVQWRGDKVCLVWPGVPGRTYYVESRTAKEPAFQVASEPGLKVGGDATHLVHELVLDAVGPESRLFRVRVAAEGEADF
jgi:hypothetical protein